MSIAIWWIRRDLRLTDNHALSTATLNSEAVIPVFILDPLILNSKNNSKIRNTFLFAGLHQLDKDLRSVGSRLTILSGNPVDVLPGLFSTIGASKIYSEMDFSPYARKRDQLINKILPFQQTGGLSIFSPDKILKSDGKPFTIYTPFRRSWMKTIQGTTPNLHPRPVQITTPDIRSLIQETHLAPTEIPLPIQPGEGEATKLLQRFSQGENPPIYEYAAHRDRLDSKGTSRLSAYIRFGMLSAGIAVTTALQALNSAPDSRSQKGIETWLNQLIWREFYIYILYHHPRVLNQNFRLRHILWENDPENFNAWCSGQTGYPIVDAAMRQLSIMGWMHNRARMIVASFLTKDLLIDWQLGASWFMKKLIDGDPAANNGGWQWAAGTGTDAAPYFRIFNPVLQSKKFDPHGSFIRKWVPELDMVPSEYIHEPWKMSVQIQKQSSCHIGEDYPSPVIDHAFARRRALEAYKRAKTVDKIN